MTTNQYTSEITPSSSPIASEPDGFRALYWHCEVAAMLLNEFPRNVTTNQHLRNAIRFATSSVMAKPRHASESALRQMNDSDSSTKGLVKEHTIPVGTIISILLNQTHPIIRVTDRMDPHFVPTSENAKWGLARSEKNQEKVIVLGNIRAWEIAEIIKKWSVVSWITQSEDQSLRDRKLHDRMPPEWDGSNVFARYDACGIKCLMISG